ncbi:MULTISPECIES: fimbria/pilus outer membrane usher protein [unclassified Duganella]|uniref:fimbria/pilus outer membrane usher protein n=1 Tax=unclassified Duganella TaxID=2636909 RepID=UPI000891FDE4|nr:MULTISPECIES: fimbria/pilus outer membrane usher protein [unclassified Duganella]SDH18114.1 outer membrane usher protein [Duganella sp. OV458]SDK32554.1 outer membrane usher protein [Duganella sp. OV510]
MRRRLAWWCLLTWWLMCGALAQTPPSPPPQDEELFLEVTLNGEATGLILRFTRGQQSGLRSSVQNLRELELDPQLFGVSSVEEFDLDRVKGLSYTYDAARQAIALRVDDALRAPIAVSARTVRKPGVASVTPGAVINYDAFSRLGKDRSTSVANEIRYFNNSGVLTSTGVFNYSSQLREYVRFDTAWVHSDPETLETWQFGDLISSSLTWSRSLRMGGVQWRRSFDLRPDLLTFPTASLGGSAVVPSAVSLYINGVRQVDTAVPSGPFVINQVAGINGAGQATLVTRDAAGRAISTSVPLYVDTRMLAEGLVDYSVELGALRRRYTSDSFGYARSPALSASLRRGISNSLTLEAHGEAGNGVLNGGGGLLWRLGQGGVISGSLAGSGGKANGAKASGGQATLGYQYLSSRVSLDLQSQRATANYSDMGTAEGSPVVRASDRLNIGVSLPGGQGISVSAVSLRAPLLPPARVVALNYSASLGLGLYLSVSAFRDYRDDKARGVFFSLSASFGDRISATASRNRQNDARTTTYTVTRSADYSGGFGWGLQSSDTNGNPQRQAQLTYLGNYGQITGYSMDSNGVRNSSVDIAGSLVVMDGSVHAARQVGAGFGLVSTDGVAGVPVMQENQVIGHTSSSGYMLVPNLTPYLQNQVGIDISRLPLDARIASSSQSVVPARMSGVLVRFPVEKYEAVSVILHDASGKPLAAGTQVLHVESGNTTVVGFDGVAFVDRLQPLNHLRASVEGVPCVVEFSYQPQPGNAMATVGPLACKAVQ